ncbi:heterokaryon incompatibility protein-domain-containing protein [Fusarium avenaceum]|nr:heterokaryon incompatibility protein-domain-containing protein [Fusarium avenaceum]
MLCATCMSMFQRRATSGVHHQTSENLDRAATNGCRICNCLRGEQILEDWIPLKYSFSFNNAWELHGEIQFYWDEELYPHKNQNWKVYLQVSKSTSIPPGYQDFLSSVNSDLALDPSRVRPDFPPLRDIQDNTGHKDVLRLAKGWLEKCQNEDGCHVKFSATTKWWCPGRLIDVGSDTRPPRLMISGQDNINGSYAALSHCWGENPEFLMLSCDDLDEFRKEIKITELPASFRDAIITCRHLGIPYIWIDSLCILQSGPTSKEDWLCHSEEMHRIYEHCLLNISIDVSSNPHQGAFRARNTLYLQDCYLWTSFPLFPKSKDSPPTSQRGFFTREDGDLDVSALDVEHVGQPNETLDPTAQQILCVIFTREDFYSARLHLPINERAWVFQERLLSRRTLYFSTDRIAWECECKDSRVNRRSKTINEYLPDGLFGSITGTFDCLYQEDYSIPYVSTATRYYDLVISYTTRQLTFPDKDKLVAFASVARRCTSGLGNDYCAGIFRTIMPIGLLWQATWEGCVRRPAAYRAPSWSWASVDSRVFYGLLYDGGKTFAQVQDVAVELGDEHNRFGQVKSAFLTITGPLIASKSISPDKLGEVTFELPVNVQTLPGSKEERNEILSQDDVFLFAILGDSEHQMGKLTLGIVLQIDANGYYHRIGLWEAKEGFMSNDGTSFETTTITIL